MLLPQQIHPSAPFDTDAGRPCQTPVRSARATSRIRSITDLAPEPPTRKRGPDTRVWLSRAPCWKSPADAERSSDGRASGQPHPPHFGGGRADKAILAGVTAAAGTALAETGVGAILGYAATALIVADMLKLINRASTIINTAGTVILGLAGTGMDLGYKGGNLTSIQLPSTAYTAPGV